MTGHFAFLHRTKRCTPLEKLIKFLNWSW